MSFMSQPPDVRAGQHLMFILPYATIIIIGLLVGAYNLNNQNTDQERKPLILIGVKHSGAVDEYNYNMSMHGVSK